MAAVASTQEPTTPGASNPQPPTSTTNTRHTQNSGLQSDVLGTNLDLDRIRKVRMQVAQKCKMGISFWPMFSFSAPNKEPQAGSVKLVSAAAAPADMIPTAVAAASQQTTSSTAGSGSSDAAVDTGSSRARCEHFLHVNFTREPPEEVSIGAQFLGGIPFPFLSIRTTRLEGLVDPCSGSVHLLFEAAMLAQVGSREPIALPLHTTMTTETASAFGTTLQGKRMEHGSVTLVSAAEVPKTSSWLANWILWLPTAATALLPMRLEFTE